MRTKWRSYRGHRLCDVTSPCLRQCLRDCRACRRAVAVVSTADTIERRTARHRVLTSINYRRIPLARVPRAECAAKKHASNSRRRCSSSHADEFDFVRADDVVINVISCLRGFDDQWWLHDGAVDGAGGTGPSKSLLGSPNSAVLLTHSGQLLLGKISKFDATRCLILRLICTKYYFRRGSLQCSPRLPSCI